MATTAPVESKSKVEKAVAFYHIGMLPYSGRIALPFGDDKLINKDECTALEYWYKTATIHGGKSPGDFQIFVTKCRRWLALDIGGVHFPSTSQHVETNDGQVNRVHYPGSVVLLTPEKLSALVSATKRNFIRYPNGVAMIDNVNINNAQMYSLDDHTKPSKMTDAEWADCKRNNKGGFEEPKSYNEDTDIPVSDYVYIKKLEGAKIDMANLGDYNKNPRRYHLQMVGPISAEFFSNPPKSVSESYPGA